MYPQPKKKGNVFWLNGQQFRKINWQAFARASVLESDNCDIENSKVFEDGETACFYICEGTIIVPKKATLAGDTVV